MSVLVPDEVRSCVCFLFRQTNGRLIAEGTGTVLAQPINGSDNTAWTMIVTARHIINSVQMLSDDDIVRARFNSKGGGVGWLELPVSAWMVNEDDLASDVAIAHFDRMDGLDLRLWPMGRLATEAVIAAQHIGLGDEVVMPGLFSMHSGDDRNIPIVRIGNIAAMPEQPVRTLLGPADAYLIEARSIGGLSGSPVFVNVGMDRSGDLKGSLLLAGSLISSHLFLLGILHGHWDVPGDVPTEDGLTSVDGPGQSCVNVGIAIVTPASKILDIWNREPDASQRAAHQRGTLTGGH